MQPPSGKKKPRTIPKSGAWMVVAYEVHTGAQVLHWQNQALDRLPLLGDKLPDGHVVWEVVGIRHTDQDFLYEVEVKFVLRL